MNKNGFPLLPIYNREIWRLDLSGVALTQQRLSYLAPLVGSLSGENRPERRTKSLQYNSG